MEAQGPAVDRLSPPLQQHELIESLEDVNGGLVDGAHYRKRDPSALYNVQPFACGKAVGRLAWLAIFLPHLNKRMKDACQSNPLDPSLLVYDFWDM